MMPCPRCGLPHTGACRSSTQRAQILSTAYSEIKEKISHTRLASKGLDDGIDDWVYRGLIRGAIVSGAIVGVVVASYGEAVAFSSNSDPPGGYIIPITKVFVVLALSLCLFALPAALFGGLIGGMVGIIGFAVTRPRGRRSRGSLPRIAHQDNEPDDPEDHSPE
jgi:hypothetical protein